MNRLPSAMVVVRCTLAVGLAVAACYLAACSWFSDKPTSPPTFPVDIETQTIIVRDHSGTERKIDDRRAIGEALRVLHGISGKWAFTWHTYPSPMTTVVFKDRAGTLMCRVDLGEDWIGSDCGELEKGWPPLTSVSTTTTSALTAAFSAPAANP